MYNKLKFVSLPQSKNFHKLKHNIQKDKARTWLNAVDY